MENIYFWLFGMAYTWMDLLFVTIYKYSNGNVYKRRRGTNESISYADLKL